MRDDSRIQVSLFKFNALTPPRMWLAGACDGHFGYAKLPQEVFMPMFLCFKIKIVLEH